MPRTPPTAPTRAGTDDASPYARRDHPSIPTTAVLNELLVARSSAAGFLVCQITGRLSSYAPDMIKMTYSGSFANLQLLAEEISEDPQLNSCCTARVTQQAARNDSLNHGQFAEIVISVAAGMATNTIYDAIRALIDRARNRGHVEPVEPTGQEE